MGIILAIIIFGFIVFIHELGHFLLAKFNGIEVQEFSIGMGPKLFGFQRKETLYSIRVLPLGGFCAMGEDEAMPVNPWGISMKNLRGDVSVSLRRDRSLIFVLALIGAIIITAWIGVDRPVVSSIEAGYPAARPVCRQET